MLTGVTSESGMFEFPASDWEEQPASEMMPLERAESKLLFSDMGVRAGLLVAAGGGAIKPPVEMLCLATAAPEVAFPALPPDGVLAVEENLLDVKMSMSAWVISSSMPL